MKRLHFLKTMGASLYETIDSLYEPAISNGVSKLEEAGDRLLGVKWYPAGLGTKQGPILEMRYIGGQPAVFYGDESNMRAVSGICPVCSNIIILTALYSTGKCLNCSKGFNFGTSEGDLELIFLKVKRRENEWFVGVPFRKEGGMHA